MTLNSADQTMLRRQRSKNHLREPMPPVLLSHSRAMQALPVPETDVSNTIDFSGTIAKARAALRRTNKFDSNLKSILREGLSITRYIIGDRPIHLLNCEIRSETIDYGQTLAIRPGAYGIHVDYPSMYLPKPTMRGLHILTAAPFSTIIFPDLLPIRADIDCSFSGMQISPDKSCPELGKFIIPDPGQWVVLQEGTPHTIPQLSKCVKDKADAVKLLGPASPWLRYFNDKGFTRILASIDIIFQADEETIQPALATVPLRSPSRQAPVIFPTL